MFSLTKVLFVTSLIIDKKKVNKIVKGTFVFTTFAIKAFNGLVLFFYKGQAKNNAKRLKT